MKFVTFTRKDIENDQNRIGVLTKSESDIIDLQESYSAAYGKTTACFDTMIALMESGEAGLALVKELKDREDAVKVPSDKAKLCAPIPRPRSMRDMMCHELHILQCRRTMARLGGMDVEKKEQENPDYFKPDKYWYEMPLYYKGNCDSFSGNEDEILFPPQEDKRDFELELAVVIGKKIKDVSPEDALDAVFGYTIFNDFSARSTQLYECSSQNHLGPAHGKDFDTGNSLGPCIVTPDEFDVNNADMIAKINGEEWCHGNTRDMYHSVNDAIAYASRSETIYPGSIIGTGTVGNGCGLENNRFLNVGDKVELEIKGIGKLTNYIKA